MMIEYQYVIKNKIIKHAKYENICILHDRFSLSKNWYKNMINFGNYLILCMPLLINMEIDLM